MNPQKRTHGGLDDFGIVKIHGFGGANDLFNSKPIGQSDDGS